MEPRQAPTNTVARWPGGSRGSRMGARMQPRRILWFGAVLAGLGAFWAWFFSLQATLYVPLCQPGSEWSFTLPRCQWLRWLVAAMWCVAALGAVVLVCGVLRWWRATADR